MAAPTNSSGTLQHTEVGGSNNANAGFTFTAGRSAVLLIACYNSSVSNIAGITIGGTAAVRRARIFLDSDHHSVEIWDALNLAGGSSTITIDYGVNTSYASFGVTEWAAGVITGFDTGTENTATGTSTAPSVSTALTTSQAATLTFAVVTNSASTASQGFAGPTSWTQVFLEQDTSITESGRGARFEHSSAGIKTATFSQTNNVSWIAAIAAYRLAASGAYTLTAEQGSFSLNGQASLALRRMIAAQGSFALTGQDAALNKSAGTYTLTADFGSFFLLGSEAQRDISMIAAHGSFALNGQTANTNRNYLVTAAQGSYTLTGRAASLSYSAGDVFTPSPNPRWFPLPLGVALSWLRGYTDCATDAAEEAAGQARWARYTLYQNIEIDVHSVPDHPRPNYTN